jgi:predicted dehydrogenase/threonine dehydrogenase-like Zn-dependent dehydrogenase
MEVLEVPTPMVEKGMVLVKNHYSLISAGTEGSTVSSARKSLIGKAKERPQQVKQVIDFIKQQGILQTYRAVMKKLESYLPLGYSSAGEVIEVASDVKGFSIGDYVACGGSGYASHAEIIAVPVNLCVKLPPDADLKKAAYNTIGAIGLQGVRQADLRIGETCAVIGLGLIGHLTCLMLRAGGIKVIGIDIEPKMVEIASQHCTDLAFVRGEAGLAEKIDEFTQGIGVDAVIITAATDSLDPVNLAGRISRKKGKVVIVGDVPTGFDREPYYYQKELELRMSCSYGPGRYDIAYEERGIDYPVGYVRWTENRNMQAFQELIHSGKIDIDYLTTHVFKLDDTPSAYDMILERKELFIGIIIEYDYMREIKREKILITPHSSLLTPHSVNIAFVGAGSYAMSHLLPNIPKDRGVVLKGVMTSRGASSRTVAEKYGFEFCTSDENDIFGNHEINSVFIATRHDTHAEYVIKALRAGKHIYVEKPLCLTIEELAEITELFERRAKGKEQRAFMIGFNRRFSPLAQLVKEKIGTGPMSMIYRINAGPLPPDSWIQDQGIGGGRILGEVCHFVDFLTFMNGSLPSSVYATALSDPAGREDSVNISLDFENGSIGTLSYFSNGSKAFFKEYVEIYKAGITGILKDFKEVEIYGNGKTFKRSFLNQDKGQKHMVRAFLDAIKNGIPLPISFEEIYTVTLATFKIMESLRLKQAVLVKG